MSLWAERIRHAPQKWTLFWFFICCQNLFLMFVWIWATLNDAKGLILALGRSALCKSNGLPTVIYINISLASQIILFCLFILVWLLLYFGQNLQHSGVIPDFCAQILFLAGSGVHLRCWGSNPGCPQARQTPYRLFYHSDLTNLFLF